MPTSVQVQTCVASTITGTKCYKSQPPNSRPLQPPKLQSGVRFLIRSEFDKLFPLPKGEKLHGIGGSKNVFCTTTNTHAVKVYKDAWQDEDFVVEMNAHAQLRHKHILAPVAFTIMGSNAYVAFLLGVPVLEACHQLSILDTAKNTIAAIRFLNDHGFAHGDIKPYNMVYVPDMNCVCMIDLGRCRRATLHFDGKYYMRGLNYTMPYQDCEYVVNQWNSILCEQQPLLLSLVQCNSFFSDVIPYFGSIHHSMMGHRALDQLIKNVLPPLDVRQSWDELLAECPSLVEKDEEDEEHNNQNIVFRLPLVPPMPHHSSNSTTQSELWGHELDMKMVLAAVVTFGYEENEQTEVVFRVLHLVRNCLVSVKVSMEFNDWIAHRRLFVCVCYNIALSTTFEDRFSYDTCQELAGMQSIDKETFRVFYNRLFAAIMIVTKGFTASYTFWDYARSYHDLPALMFDLVFLKARSDKIRSAPGCDTNKSFCMKAVLAYDEYQMYLDYMQSRVDPPSSRYDHVALIDLLSTQVYPTCVDIGSDVQIVRNRWKSITNLESKEMMVPLKLVRWREDLVQKFFRCVLHNRASLHLLDDDEADLIFRNLLALARTCEWRGYAKFLLKEVCKIDFKPFENTNLTIDFDHPPPFVTPFIDSSQEDNNNTHTEVVSIKTH